MNDRKRDALAELTALARATDDLRPTAELTDAVLRAIDPADAALARAARLTADLAPTASFTDAVMRAAGVKKKAPPAWSEGVARWGRVALFGAAAAAAASVVLSTQAEHGFDSAVLEGVAFVEVDE
jgi:hypothetical protein